MNLRIKLHEPLTCISNGLPCHQLPSQFSSLDAAAQTQKLTAPYFGEAGAVNKIDWFCLAHPLLGEKFHRVKKRNKPMHQILTERSHSCHCDLTHRIRVYPWTPLSNLSDFFPDGIPVSAPYPTLDLRGRECFELAALESLSFSRRVDLMQILFAEGVPDAIGYAYLFYQTVAIPTQWVEEV